MGLLVGRRLGFCFITLLACGLCLRLGFWQLDRLAWKQDLLHQQAQALKNPAQDIPVTFKAIVPYQTYRFQGTCGLKATQRQVFGPKGNLAYHTFRIGHHPSGWNFVIDLGTAPTCSDPLYVRFHRLPPKTWWRTPSVDIHTLAQDLGMHVVTTFIAHRADPKQKYTPPEMPNNHLGYAITWFMLALGLAIAGGVGYKRF